MRPFTNSQHLEKQVNTIMATNLFNTVFENASTKEQVINAFSEALDALINAKTEAVKNLSTKKSAKKTKATETKTAKTKAAETKATKEKAENKEYLSIDAAVIKKSKNGITVVDIKPEIVKMLDLHYKERSEKSFWVYGDTKPVLSFIKAHHGGFSKTGCIVNGEAVPAWSFAKKGHEEAIRKAFGI